MEENLFPDELDEDIDDELLVEDENEEVAGYKIAPSFDSASGDFLLNGSGQIIDADEIEAYTQWCENIIATDRYNHDAYTDDIGIDYSDVFASNDRKEIEIILESEISEALACDPYGRTQYVQNVEFDWISPDEIVVSVDIVALDNELVTVSATITK